MNQYLQFDLALVYLLVFNSLAAGLFYLAATRIPRGALRLSFLAMLAASLLYLNPANYFWHPSLGPDAKMLLTRIGFTGALLLAGAVTVFLIYFTENRDEFRRWRFRLFSASLLFLIAANAGGFVVRGLAGEGASVHLEYGPLHPLFVGCYLGYALYFSYLGWRGYRRCQSEILQIQLQTLGLAGGFAFAAIVISNGVLPLFLGKSSTLPFATLCVLSFYGSILYILLNGEILVVVRSVRRLLKEESFRSSENRQALRMLVHHLKDLVSNNPAELHRRVAFQTAGGQTESFFVSKGARFEAGPIQLEEGVPPQWYAGVQRTAARLEQENLRLSLGLEKAKMLLHENRIAGPTAVEEPLAMPTPVGLARELEEEEDPVEMLALELKHPARTFTIQEALDVLHEDEFHRELENGTILPVSDSLFRIATPQRYMRYFPQEQWEADFP